MKPRRQPMRERSAASSDVPALLLRHREGAKPTTQKRSAITRGRLEDAGLALFAKKGFEGTSIAEIAKEANVAVGAFYIYFESKRELLLVLMERLISALGGVRLNLQTERNPQTALRAFLEQAFSYDLRYLGAYRTWVEATSSDDDLRPHDQAIRAWSQRRVKALIKRLRLLPGARRNVNIGALSAVLDRMFWGLLGEMLIVSPAEQRKRLRTAADLAYHAIFHVARADASRFEVAVGPHQRICLMSTIIGVYSGRILLIQSRRIAESGRSISAGFSGFERRSKRVRESLVATALLSSS